MSDLEKAKWNLLAKLQVKGIFDLSDDEIELFRILRRSLNAELRD